MRSLVVLIKNLAGFGLSAAYGASMNTGDPNIQALLLGAAAALLFVQTWAESHADNKEAAVADIRRLIEKHGTLTDAVDALAAGIEQHHAITQAHAAAVLLLLRSSEAELQTLAEQKTGLIVYAANYLAEQQERLGEAFAGLMAKLDHLGQQVTGIATDIATAPRLATGL
jgi:hypothetical protein